MKDFAKPLIGPWMEQTPSVLSRLGKFVRCKWKRLCIMFVIIAGVCGFKLYPREPEPVPREPVLRDTEYPAFYPALRDTEYDERAIHLLADGGSGGIIITGTAGGISITREGSELVIEEMKK